MGIALSVLNLRRPVALYSLPRNTPPFEQETEEESIKTGKPPALPGDSQSLTVPGVFLFCFSGGSRNRKASYDKFQRPNDTARIFQSH
jgi:hypothetical protein